MLKQVAFGLVMVVSLAVPARADLHYTLHTEARQVTTADPVNPMFGIVSDILMRSMFPDGATDTTYWVTDNGMRVELTKGNAFSPEALAKSTANMMGLGGLISEGFMLRNVMRNSMMPGFEIESVVTSITEEPAPADAFDIPADYKEVAAPALPAMPPPPPR